MKVPTTDNKALRDNIARLMDEDEDTRYDAARVIARLGRPALPRALAWADDPRPRMREMACFILGQIGDRNALDPIVIVRYPEGVPILLGLLEKDPEAEVRSAAAAALGHHAAPGTVPALVRAASDPSAIVRFEVAFALGSFYWVDEDQSHKSAAAAALLRLMDDQDEDVRDWATFGIHQGSHDTPETRARLWQALDDANPDVRGEAAEGLALFGDRSLIPRLDVLLREDEALPSLYFMAAEELADPVLLPAVVVGAERWQAMGAEMHASIVSALEALGGKGTIGQAD